MSVTKKENNENSEVKLDLYPIRSLTILRKCRVLHVTTFGKSVLLLYILHSSLVLTAHLGKW